MKITGRINRLQRKLQPPGADREEFERLVQIRTTMGKMLADPQLESHLGKESVEKLRVWYERASRVVWRGRMVRLPAGELPPTGSPPQRTPADAGVPEAEES